MRRFAGTIGVGAWLFACSAPPAPAPRASHAEPIAAKDTPDAGAATAAPPPPSPPAPTKTEEPTPVGTILIIGDSHSFGPFGPRLHALFATTSEHVVFEAACGATTEMFLFPAPEVVCGYRVHESKGIDGERRAVVSTWHNSRIHNLDYMMKTYDPKVVVVVLGTNYPRAPVADSTEAFMKRLCRNRATCPRVFWIGPPAFGVEAGIYISKTIRGVLEGWKGATFVDSTSFNVEKPLPIRKPHFGDDEARRWAEFAFGRIAPDLTARAIPRGP